MLAVEKPLKQLPETYLWREVVLRTGKNRDQSREHTLHGESRQDIR